MFLYKTLVLLIHLLWFFLSLNNNQEVFTRNSVNSSRNFKDTNEIDSCQAKLIVKPVDLLILVNDCFEDDVLGTFSLSFVAKKDSTIQILEINNCNFDFNSLVHRCIEKKIRNLKLVVPASIQNNYVESISGFKLHINLR